jgi:hypothetical protein
VVKAINGLIKSLVIFFIVIMVFSPTASAWHVITHENIAEKIYYSMPPNVQHNLNLSEMRRGAAAPDLIFKDSKDGGHKYPKSYQKAENWLKKGKTAYHEGNYNHASYCFGIASHYISDSYVVTHCANISKSDHKDYERRSKGMKPSTVWYMGNQFKDIDPSVAGYNENLKSELAEAYETGETRWNMWIEKRNMALVQLNLDKATGIAYGAIRECVY